MFWVNTGLLKIDILTYYSGNLKRICETDLGLISQCCLTKYVLKVSKQYLSNVSLKINVKVCQNNFWLPISINAFGLFIDGEKTWNFLVCSSIYQMGGRNTVLLDALRWKIPLVSDIPTIIFGADVTHPERGEESSPSIAAVRIQKLSIKRIPASSMAKV